MNFVTYYDLIDDITENISAFSDDIDIIVGIPRSGQLVASVISLYLNKPLSDLDSFLEKRIYDCGTAKIVDRSKMDFENVKTVLIVEDTVFKGRSILKAKDRIENSGLKDIRFIYFAAYVVEETKELVDIYFRIVEQPRMFEWNYLHHPGLLNACVDLDGFLCVDPSKEQNDDGVKYLDFLKNAKIKLKPSRKVAYIVTSRLEKYRKQTEKWLQDHEIEHDELFMMNLESAKERQRLNNHASFKAEQYKRLKECDLFIESNDNQAKEINRISGKAVFCPTSHQFYKENAFVTFENDVNKKKDHMFSSLKSKIKKILFR